MNSKEKREMRKRKPFILLVCEGKNNKTETNYFNNFNLRGNKYVLKIVGSESTDVDHMMKKTAEKYKHLDLDPKLGDKAYCLIDLDNSQSQASKVESATNKKQYRNIQIILSNPCFEIWLLNYFVQSSKSYNDSKEVKKALKKIVPKYEESYDIYKLENLKDKNEIALKNATLQKREYKDNTKLNSKNPYTEVDEIVKVLLSMNV